MIKAWIAIRNTISTTEITMTTITIEFRIRIVEMEMDTETEITTDLIAGTG